jgi:MFS family permease
MTEASQAAAVPGAADHAANGRKTLRTISWHLLPLLSAAYFFCVIDRVNLSFAALTMNADLSFTPLTYAWGAGLFFIGYALFEVPSNMLLVRIGSRIWLPRIIVSWGTVSCATALVSSAPGFYALRFLLGAAEAGFFPGVVLYLIYWYPPDYRARVLSAFILASPVSAVVGGSVSGFILGLDGSFGLKGWQWLFILEGLPTIALGLVSILLLPDRPATARWLGAEQKNWIAGQLAEAPAKQNDLGHSLSIWPRPPATLVSGVIYLGMASTLYSIQLWLPQIVQSFGLTNMRVGFVSALPFAVSSVAMFLWGRHSDRSGERVLHVALPFFVSALALFLLIYAKTLVVAISLVTMATVGAYCAFGVFWTLSSTLFSDRTLPVAIAMVNSFANIGSFSSVYLIGWLKQTTGAPLAGMVLLAVLPLLAGFLTLGVVSRMGREGS